MWSSFQLVTYASNPFPQLCTIQSGVWKLAVFNLDLQIMMSFQAVAVVGGLRGINQCCTLLVTTTRGGMGGDTALQVGRVETPSGALPCLKNEEGTVNGSRANIAFQTSCLKEVAQRPIRRLETDERKKRGALGCSYETLLNESVFFSKKYFCSKTL